MDVVKREVGSSGNNKEIEYNNFFWLTGEFRLYYFESFQFNREYNLTAQGKDNQRNRKIKKREKDSSGGGCQT